MPPVTEVERSVVQHSLAPDAYSAATATGDGVATAGYKTAEVILDLGAMGTNATLDVHIEYRDLDGNWNDLLGEDGSTQVAFAQLTQAGTDDSDQVVRGELRIGELPDHDQLRAIGVVGTAAVDFGVSFRLSDPYKAPVEKAATANAFYSIIGVGARPENTVYA